MEWIVHIGTTKTGSKAIQDFLVHESHRIKGRTLCFPKSGQAANWPWHRPIFEELFTGQSDLLQAAIQEGIESLADSGILSYEAWYTLTEPKIKKLHRLLGTARIILFIRRQDQLMNSRYNQLIKSSKRGYNQIVNFESSFLDYEPDLDHMRTLQKWGAVFGHENLVPIIYDKQKDSIEQLLRSIGVSADFDNYRFRNPNPALDSEALSVFRAVKQQNSDSACLPDLINAALSILADHFVDTYATGEDQYLFTMAEREAIYRHYTNSNEQVRRLFFPDKESLFPPLEPGDVHPTDLPVDQAIVRAIFDKARCSSSVKPAN